MTKEKNSLREAREQLVPDKKTLHEGGQTLHDGGRELIDEG